MTTHPVLTIPISGMNCASCVARCERALAAVPQVLDAQVNFAAGQGRVTFRDAVEVGPVLEALESAGYPAVTETVRLRLEGMTCASCVSRVEMALTNVPGVVSASVNFASSMASVTGLAGQLTAADLAAAVSRAGYRAIPEDGQAPADDGAQARALRRDAVIAACLALPVVVLEMGGHIVPAFHHWVQATIGLQVSWVVQFVLATLVLAGPGRRFLARGLPSLVRGAPDMNSLVALGTLAAWSYSTIATFAPGLLPQASRTVYFEAAVVIVVLILVGRLLEAQAKGRTGAAIQRLVGLQPKTARVLRDGVEHEVALETIATGDLLLVGPGERIAVDGIVTDGQSFVDEAMISGEPVPVDKAEGAEVTGGTVNGNGVLSVQATRVGSDTRLAGIIAMVQQAQAARLPVQSLVNRVTLWFVPVVIAVAVAAAGLWLAFGAQIGMALVAAVSVLIIACPCAMGLAVPTSIMVGTGRAADLGVLFRKGDALQSLQAVAVVAFDKTGTLTQGRPDLADLQVVDGWAEDDALSLIAAAEAGSEHPIAAAIVQAAQGRGLDIPLADRFEALPGYGLSAGVSGQSVLVGAGRLFKQQGIDLGRLAEHGEAMAALGRTPLYAAVDGQAVAVLAVADRIRPESRAAIDALHGLGLRVAMITGDNAATADHVARALGIDEVVADVLPDGKVAALQALAASGPVAFVGDGINDAPALAAASVGIAIGTGTDVAIEAADVVLMRGDPQAVVTALEISRSTMANIRQNLAWAFGYNILLIPVAAGLLYPVNGLLLSPQLAAGAMALSSVFVLANALRLRWVGTARGNPDLPRGFGQEGAPA